MSLAGEWFLAVHRAIWFPILYAMGLEREPIEVYPIDAFKPAVEASAGVSKQVAAGRRLDGYPRKKPA